MPITLTGVKVHMIVGSDGLDSNSTFFFLLYEPGNPSIRNIADYRIGNTQINPHDVYDHPLDMHDNTFLKSQLNNCRFYLEINAVGHDKIDANLTVEFSFSDGSIRSWNYGGFEIGTYRMSHTTQKDVHLDNLDKAEGNIITESLIENPPIQFIYVMYLNGEWESRTIFKNGQYAINKGYAKGHPVAGDIKFKESICFNNTWINRSIQYY